MKHYNAIGLMSGTSIDGVDAAIISSNGNKIKSFGDFISIKYEPSLRKKIKKLIFDSSIRQDKEAVEEIERELTIFHADVVNKLLQKTRIDRNEVEVIGFHGHTIEHQPQQKKTWQIGCSKLLAKLTGIGVVGDFRYNDIQLGGQGAPLIPLYHKAIIPEDKQPAIVLNIGGVANLTYLDQNSLIAFDTGPGNALIDDFMHELYGAQFDKNGEVASSGYVDKEMLELLMTNIYFQRKAPKSLDRNHFYETTKQIINSFGMTQPADIIATLSEFTVQSIIKSLKLLPTSFANMYICGGGVENNYIVSRLDESLSTISVGDISKVNNKLNPDAIEAQGFAFLAIRSLMGLPLTYSTTTGVKKSSATGGVFYPA